jgi:hypothetical protein
VNHLPNLITDETLAAPDPTSASPQWWGADSTRTRMRNADTGDSVFIKTTHATGDQLSDQSCKTPQHRHRNP